jgi:hypothetical protein
MPHGLRSRGNFARTGVVLALALSLLFSQPGSAPLDRDVLLPSNPYPDMQTMVPGSPPPPVYPVPTDGASGQMPMLDLLWHRSVGPDPVLNWEIYFGTTTPPPLVATIPLGPQYYPTYHVEGLELNTTYYWQVVALGENETSTAGALWSFSTGMGGEPPDPPAFPEPKNGATGVGLPHYLGWSTHDPEGESMDYDIYLGTDPDPPLYASHQYWCCGSTGAFNQPVPLQSLTTYYWRVVARDPGGNETSSPVWYYTTGANHEPLVPDTPIPPDNAPDFSSSTLDLKWQGGDPDHHSLLYDVYFGTDPSPPLVATNVASVPYAFAWHTSITSYAAGPFTNGMTYYWKIVAHDPEGAVTEGPVWTFTADENQAPIFDAAITPAEAAVTPVIQGFSWSATDPNLDPMTYDLYLGTTNPPPLFRYDLAAQSYTPLVADSPLLTGSTYYWYVVSDDGLLQTTSPTHTFTTVPPGDVTRDGMLTVADANCIMNLVVFKNDCAQAEGRARADVNCDGFITPADARCLHKNVLDASCTLCPGGTTPAPRPPLPPLAIAQGPSSPVVEVLDAWIEWDTLKVSLGVSGVPSLKSLGIGVEVSPHALNSYNDWQIVVRRKGATQDFQPFFDSIRSYTTWDDRLIAGYTLGEVDCTSETELLELNIYLPARTFDYVKFSNFVDDLAGAPDVTVLGDNVPVLFSVFTATPRAGGIGVSWELQSDEAMESYTLYRREGNKSLARVIASGIVTGMIGSFFDREVTPGTTYHYELAIHTTDGDTFRSPIADARLAPMKLALYQNRPNPFNPQTTISYDLPPGSTRVRLCILDVAGRLVRTLVDENQPGGSHSAVWDGNGDRNQRVSSGVYFYVLDAGGKRLTKKLVLLK